MPEFDTHSASGQIFHHSDCLTLEQLAAYAEDRVAADERFVIEKHLVDCELCSDALEGFTLLEEKSAVRDRIKSMNEMIRETVSSTVTHKYNWKLYYSLAASIVIAFAAVLYFRHHTPSYDSLFTEYFKPYPNAVPLLRGEESGGTLESAMAEYESANYGEALTILKTIATRESKNDTAYFYAGISSLCLNDPQAAVSFLQSVPDRGGFAEQKAWYLGLAYLKQNDVDTAKYYFDRLSSKEGRFSQRSIELLNRLK